ncbi:MAG: carbohydrate ABC transporter permease [Aggregatilineales bacterium]
MKLTQTSRTFNTVGYGVALLYALTIIVPISFIVLSAFKDHSDILANPLSLPTNLSIDNFFEAQERANLLTAMLNTASVIIGAEVFNLVFCYVAAYGIARIKLAESRLVEAVFSAGFLIPAFAIILPVFLLAANLGVLYEPGYLIAFYAVSRFPLTIVILASAMRQIPQDFEDSAVIDGANRLQVIQHVFLPLTRSAVATVIILNFLYVWNEYLFALILLPGDFKTIQLAVPLLRAERSVDYGLISAGIVISLIPIYIIFIIFQESIVKGLTSGGLKG